MLPAQYPGLSVFRKSSKPSPRAKNGTRAWGAMFRFLASAATERTAHLKKWLSARAGARAATGTRGSSRGGRLFQPVVDLGDAGLGASLVLLAAGSAADGDGADGLLVHVDRHA